MLLKNGMTVLFQGDSVTDCGRSRENLDDLSAGYPGIIASEVAAKYPYLDVRFINRGVSGNRVRDLRARWSEDCVDLKPDVVSILIGINDTWRRYDSSDPTSAEKYKEDYKFILDRTLNETNAKVMILEPFVMPATPDRNEWRADLEAKIFAARELAWQYGAYYIPFDGIFAAATAARGAKFWSPDGVHPNMAGHALIAKHWIELVENI